MAPKTSRLIARSIAADHGCTIRGWRKEWVTRRGARRACYVATCEDTAGHVKGEVRVEPDSHGYYSHSPLF